MTTEIEKLGDGIVRLPDGSIGYSAERAIIEARRMKPTKYTLNDIILLLFYAQPNNGIIGRTRLFKETFLIEREVFSKQLFRWNYVPGDDEQLFRNYLVHTLDQRWAQNAKMRKADDNKSIIISAGNTAFTLMLDENDRALLLDRNHDWRRIATFFVRREKDGELYIYAKLHAIEDSEFVPYLYGPYSFHLANKIESLIENGLISREGPKNSSGEQFHITEKGVRYIKEKFDRLPQTTKANLIAKRKGYDQYRIRGILNHVYSHYPHFKKNSKIGHRFKSITWGRGKG